MSTSEHTPAELQQIDSICDQFEFGWKSGNTPDLYTFSRQIPVEIKPACLLELVVLDAFYRRQAGDAIVNDQSLLENEPGHNDAGNENRIWRHYVERFPELATAECPFEPIASDEDTMIDQRFRVIDLQAIGGLGRVSIADDVQFGRHVAIKEIRAKYSEQKIYRQRFLREAEIAGRLEHPSIVPVYAMGQQDNGQPYYAMRLIQGRSLQAAINEYHVGQPTELTVELRKLLHRLIDVCEAAEYAHSQHVIHRDIKPDNIMLGDYGETLLVDWGLAKVVGQQEMALPETIETESIETLDITDSQTRSGMILGTPAYMSPEQANGEIDRIDRRSDVFSLGATLIHLIHGNPPIQEFGGGVSNPPASNIPVKTGRTLQALVAVGKKATSPLPIDRYQSAREFADDIELILADQPISIFQDPMGIRVWRWARHHRGLAGAIVAAVCLAMVGLAVFSWLTGQHSLEVEGKNRQLDRLVKQETRLRNEAEKSEQRTMDAMTYLVGALRSPDPNLDGREIMVVEILQQAVEQLDTDFSEDPLMLAQMLHAIGSTYNGLGQFEEAKNLLQRAVSIYESELGSLNRKTLMAAAKLAELYQRVDDPQGLKLIAEVLHDSGTSLPENDADRLEIRRMAAIIQMQTGDVDQASRSIEVLVPIFESVFGEDASPTLSLMNDLANAYHLGGRSGDAAAISKQVYETRLAETGAQSLSTITNGSNYAIHLLNSSDRKQAKLILEKLLTDSRQSLGDEHFQTLAIMSKLGTLYVKDNELTKGLELLNESKRRSETRYGATHSRTLVAANGLGVAYLESGDYENAAQHLRTVYDASVKTRGGDHPETLTVANNLASAYRLGNQLESAIEIFVATLQAQEKRQGTHHPNTLRSMLNLAATMQLASQEAESIAYCRKVYKLAIEHIGIDSGQAQTALSLEAMAHLKLEDFEQAKTVLQTGLDSRTRTIPNHWLRYNTMSLLGEAHLKLGDLERAEPLLLESYQAMLDQKSKIPVRARTRIDQARQRLVDLYTAKNMPDKANEYRDD